MGQQERKERGNERIINENVTTPGVLEVYM
jgi:hypothetical protein